MKPKDTGLVHAIKEFSKEASGILFWTGFMAGILLGLLVSAAVLIYFNARMYV